MKPWYSEREFVLSVMLIIGGIYLIAIGHESMGERMILTAAGSFVVSRGLAKIGTAPTKEPK